MSKEFDFWANLEPMKYYDKEYDTLSDALKKKYDAMRYNEGNEYVATEKNDGEWGMLIKWDGQYLIRSRSKSKVTGTYGDKTAHLPHIVECMKQWPDNSVVLAEICWNEYGTVSTDVGTILRCLPDKAVSRQKDKKLIAKVFDVLAWEGVNHLSTPYKNRLSLVQELFDMNILNMMLSYKTDYIMATTVCPEDKTPAEFADEIISKGGEGCVIQRKDYIYEPGKRSAWKTLKLKQKMPEMELQVVDTIAANKDYQGKEIDSWEYWIDGKPVTKPYYYGWKMGIRVDFNGTMVDVSSGLTDADREWLASSQAAELIEIGQLYATIKAMQVASLGGLRHPVVKKLRIMDDDMLEKVEVE